ncbi:MAG: UbiA family prenyltransferase [Chloroflexi bacterium]|nr:UbiA family prenyltransferase [Chloroflexota bacterium]
MGLFPKLKAYAHLGRLPMSPLTISVPILSTFALDEMALSLTEWLGLVGLGLTTHLFGFALNDLIDHPVDRTHPARQKHPLTTGALTRHEAWSFTLLQIPLAFLFLWLCLSHGWAGSLMLGASLVCSIIYDLWSKWGRLPRLIPEIALAASVSLLGLSVMFARTTTPPTSALLWAMALGLGLLLLNSVSSGLKDLKTDLAYGARSFVIAIGTRVETDDSLLIPPALRRYSLILQSLMLVATLYLVVEFHPPLLVLIFSLILSIYGALHLRMLLTLTSFRGLMASLPLLHGHYTYTSLVLLLADRLPLLLQLLVALLVFSLLQTPVRLALTMWRRGYQPLF